MLIRQIALLSQSKKVAAPELTRVSAALQKQVMRDFSPVWNIQATVDSFASEADVPAGYWKVIVMDKIPAKGAAGFHLDRLGQPFADVVWSPAWSLTASHEILEMLVDPFAHQIATGPSPIPTQGRVNFLVEVCDPCESAQFAYTINSGSPTEVPVSDFYTPEYFSPAQAPGVRYSFRGNIKSPREVLQGGYLSWQNPADSHIWQQFGPIGMRGFEDHGAGATLSRINTDKLARVQRAKKIVVPPRTRGLITGAAGGCNLVPDLGSGSLRGTAGNITTILIQASQGVAKFLDVRYNGSQVPIASDGSATFSIAKGSLALDFVYGASVPGDSLTIVDPCGSTLDAFFNNLGEPTRQDTVIA